jgi:thiol-disulfide isomerase/thioredoxin
MNDLETQAIFESLWFSHSNTENKPFIVYYTAAWCKPCKNLDTDAIAAKATANGIEIWKCDDTVNSYTAGYAGVRKFPTFVFYTPEKEYQRISSNDTEKVLIWIDSCPGLRGNTV